MIINKEGMDEGIENGKMEELMNYKEKYEKALERAKVINPGTADYEVAVKIFPELKESEDERVRKELIEYLKSQGASIKWKFNSWIAWLEKQDEQKSEINNVLKKAFDSSKKDYSLEEKKEASDYSESIIPTSVAYGESEEEYMLHKIIEAAFIAGQNSKQKPTWSEEDEEMVKGLNNCLDELEEKNEWHFIYINDKDVELDKVRNWLKSLKERMKGE